MVANSLQDVYALIYGWHIYGRLWSMLEETGLIWMPFIFAIINISVEARNSGSDEGNPGFLAVKRIETKMVSLFFVLLIICKPHELNTTAFNVSSINYEATLNECKPLLSGRESNAKIEVLNNVESTIGNQNIYIPVFWGLVHSLSTAIVSASIAALPCSDPIDFASYQFNQASVTDDKTLKDLEFFYKECYREAKANYSFYVKEGEVDGNADISWIGSEFFLSDSRFYGDIRIGPLNENEWAGDPKFSNYARPDLSYVACKTFWEKPTVGLFDRILDSVDPDVKTTAVTYLYDLFGADDQSAKAKENYVVKNVLSTTQSKKLDMSLSPSYVSMNARNDDPSVRDIVPTAVLFFKSFGKDVEKYVIRKSRDYVLSLITLLFIICLPFVMLLGGLSWKVVAITSVGYFAMEMINFIFAVAYWAEMIFLKELARYNLVGWDARYIMEILSTVMYSAFPAMWLMLVGWSGYGIYQGINSTMGISNNDAGQAGNQAASTAQSITTKGAGGAIKGVGANPSQGSLKL